MQCTCGSEGPAGKARWAQSRRGGAEGPNSGRGGLWQTGEGAFYLRPPADCGPEHRVFPCFQGGLEIYICVGHLGLKC